jgi:amiloride-sensitive sodium channel
MFDSKISKDFDSYGRHQHIDWTIDGGYKNSSDNLHPIRAAKRRELSFTLMINKEDENNLCTEISDNFQLFVTRSEELVTPLNRVYALKFDKNYEIKISAKKESAENNLKKFSPQNRGCYFEDEKKLQFFSAYTKNNCEFECMTNYTFKVCNCVKFSMPRNDSMKVCSTSNESLCFYKEIMGFPANEKIMNECECYTRCNDINYRTTVNKQKEKFKSSNMRPVKIIDLNILLINYLQLIINKIKLQIH